MKNLLRLIPFSLLLLILVAAPVQSFAQANDQVFLGSWTSPDNLPAAFFGVYNDVWGVEVDGKEYGVIGSTMGVHFISLDEPDSPQEVAFVPGKAQGTALIHRDYHSYQNYLYTVADEGPSSLQVIDFSGLPESVEVVYDSDEFIVRAHNIFIDEENARLYTSNGVQVFDLSNPETPVLLDHLATHNLGHPSYAHDIFVRDNILYLNGGNTGFAVIDYNDPNNPILLGTMYDYPNKGYNHSGWLSDDGQHYYLCDETGGADVKTVSVDDFTDMEILDRFKADNDNPEHIAHNAMIVGDILYVSYYSDGLQAFDISDPENVERIWNYDTYPGKNDSGFKGAWGIFARFTSGRLLVSDFDGGLFIFAPPQPLDFYHLEENLGACSDEETLSFDLFVSEGFEEGGLTLTAEGLPADMVVEFSQNPAPANRPVKVTISNFTTPGEYSLTLSGTDGVNEVETIANFTIASNGPASPVFPEDDATDIPINPVFEWEGQANEYLLEISPTPSFGFGTFSFNLTDNTYAVPTNELLTPDFTYYWRVTTLGSECGEATTEVQTFTTGSTVSTKDLGEQVMRVFPNPARDVLEIACSDNCNGIYDIELLDLSGRQVQTWRETVNPTGLSLNVDAQLNGLYILRMANAQQSHLARVLFSQ
ncbi:MAG: choice-of-anchor B family protein [Bacteroidota bacterium]